MNQKAFINIVLAVCMAFAPMFVFMSCDEVGPQDLNVAVTGITVDSKDQNQNIVIGGSVTLKVQVLPDNATNKKVKWRSDDLDVVVVDDSGKATATGIGQTTVYATTEDGEKEAAFEITVIEKSITEINQVVAPSKMIYGINEPFDPAGIKMKTTYNDGTTEYTDIIIEHYACDFSQAGVDKTVIVTYNEGKTAIISGITVLTLTERINKVLGTTSEIILYADEDIALNSSQQGIILPVNTNLTLRGSESERIITMSCADNFFEIKEKATLTLGENITLDGSETPLKPQYNVNMVFVRGGTFTMKDGSKITGHNNDGYAVFIGDGIFNMEGGIITGNTSRYSGAGVTVHGGRGTNGIFNMTGGSVVDNKLTERSANGRDVAVYRYEPYGDSGDGSAVCKVSGDAQIGNLSLSAANDSKITWIEVYAPFSGCIESVDLQSTELLDMAQIKERWINKQIIKPMNGTTIDVDKFSLGEFWHTTIFDLPTEDINIGYKLTNEGFLMAK